MAHADDLLEVARELANRQNPTQACLSRAVSTAYYALFHLLVSEATANWSRPELRSQLARLFEHGKMKNASREKRADIEKTPETQRTSCTLHLYKVVDSFVRVQQEREEADYNTAREWTQTEALSYVDKVADVFQHWNAVRDEPEAQAYLVSLLGRR